MGLRQEAAAATMSSGITRGSQNASQLNVRSKEAKEVTLLISGRRVNARKPARFFYFRAQYRDLHILRVAVLLCCPNVSRVDLLGTPGS